MKILASIEDSKERRTTIVFIGLMMLIVIATIIVVMNTPVSTISGLTIATNDIHGITKSVEKVTSNLGSTTHGDIAITSNGENWSIRYGTNTLASGKSSKGDFAFGSIYSDNSYCVGISSSNDNGNTVLYRVLLSNTGLISDGTCPTGAVGLKG